MADNYQIDLMLDEIFGTGISSIEQTTVSTMPGGENVWTVTLTNGNSYDFTVLNGTAGGDPIPALTVSAMTDTSAVYLYLGSETGYTFGHWYYYNGAWTDGGAYGAKGDKGDDGFSPTASVSKSGTTTTITITDENGTTTAEVEDGVAPEAMIAEKVSDWLDENITEPTGVVIDTSLQVAGAAADSKAVGDEIADLRSAIAQGGGFNAEVKQALMNCFNYVAWKDNDPNASQYINALQNALYPPVNLVSISAVYTQSGIVYNTDSLDVLRDDLVVTALYSDSTTGTVTEYALTGTLAVGTSTITVTYGGKTATFNVEVTYDSPYLYELSAPVTMTGTQSVDTGVKFAAGQTITILADFTPTTIDSTVRFGYSNQIDTETTYMGLQFKVDANSKYMWGMGRGWNAGYRVVDVNKRYRVAVVAETSSSACNCTQYMRDVIGAATKASVNTSYTAMAGVLNDSTIKIGDATTGFIGTIHDFKIYNGAMSSADINTWLENGA